MPWGLKRYQQACDLHFITFSCYRRQPLLGSTPAKRLFEQALEQARRQYGFYITGYVIMPEHVHLLVSEPEHSSLAVAIQMLKQIVAQELRPSLAPRVKLRQIVQTVPTLSPKEGDKDGAPQSTRRPVFSNRRMSLKEA